MLDKNKLVQVAQKLGLEIEFNSQTPGILFEESSSLIPFSELKSIYLDGILNENGLTSETYSVDIVATNLPTEEIWKNKTESKTTVNYFYKASKKRTKKEYIIGNKDERKLLIDSNNNQGVLAA